ncbi:MAG: tRNA 4-thiouridine(8) synthase ThiI [Spirochaetales bacterium]|nr:tRNA 4-thiouridine(8) synthase ThiI [Spirochaetales bacterium]
MEQLYLIKYGEISLKGKNRKFFEQKLMANIKQQLKPAPFSLLKRVGRLYLEYDEQYEQQISQVLKRVFGIVGFCKALRTRKDINAIGKAALLIARQLLEEKKGTRFKIEARRTDKGFAYNSYQIACKIGDLLRSHYKDVTVDVARPDWIINIEVREHAYIYGPASAGRKGLPAGCNGKGLLLLSGGIDSPVAGFLMAKRGLTLDAVYFHTHPFTSQEVLRKVEDLAKILAAYIPGLKLYIVDFTEAQLALKERGSEKALTLFSRAAMMRITSALARRFDALCLVTGESLGQVASQTPASMHFTGSFSTLPVFRPLIGMDKEDIIDLAKQYGTYELSIQPYPDCCALFAPQHPLTRPDVPELITEFNNLAVEEILEKTGSKIECREF